MTGGGAAARRERGRREMRQAILASARRLIDEGGLTNLSMRAIARDLGYSPAALYEYFAAKEEVARTLYFEGSGGLQDRMRDARAAIPAGTSPIETVKELGRAYRAYARAQPELYRLISGGPVPGVAPNGQDRDQPRGGFEVLIATIAEAVAAGDLMPLPPQVLALTAWSGVHGFVMLELNGFLPGPAGPERDALFEEHLNLMMTGMLRR